MSPDGSRSAVMTRSPASLGSAPTIVTDRLVLRGFREGDFGAFHALSADEQVMSQITGRALTTDESWTRMTSFAGSWLLTGIGAWAVESRDDATLAGVVGLTMGRRGLKELPEDAVDMTWVFARERQRQGLAYEACTAILSWADRTFDVDTIWAIITPQNLASLRLAERLGFTPSGESLFRGREVLLLRRRCPGA